MFTQCDSVLHVLLSTNHLKTKHLTGGGPSASLLFDQFSPRLRKLLSCLTASRDIS